MAEGATRTRRVLLVGSSLTYYNGGIDAIVLQLTKETGGGGRGGSVLRLPVPCSRESRVGQAGQYVNRRRPTSEGRLANNKINK
jgi:hypothetical protein